MAQSEWYDECNHEGLECEFDRFGNCTGNCYCLDCTVEVEDSSPSTAS